MKKKYLLLSFIEGACVMGAEIVSAKLLAPFYGGSLYVWSTVLALTLGGLAAGYFYGGIISAKSDLSKQLRNMLYWAALCIALMPFMSYYGVPYVSYLSFYPAIVFSAFVLIVPPLFFLGSTSPLFIALQTQKPEEAGRVGGTVYAVSTLGGIVAAFVSGFYLIPDWGLKFTAFFYALLLAGTTFLVFRKMNFAVFTLPLAFFLSWKEGTYSQHGRVLYQAHGILGECEVIEYREEKQNEAQNGKQGRDTIMQEGKRILSINKIIQTEMDVRSSKSLSDYLKQLDTLIPDADGGRALVLGLGGGLSANLLVEKGYQVDGVELDERIIACAKNFFHLDPTVKTYHDDARHFLNTNKTKYAVILVDVFKAEEQPSHVLTLESLRALKENNLTKDAVIWINWHGYVTGTIANGTNCLLRTLAKSGFSAEPFTTNKPEHQRNTLLKVLPIAELVTEGLANTDDCPVLESANALANKNWREQYLRYYQNRK